MLKRVLIPVLAMGLLVGVADEGIASKAKKINLAAGKKVYQTYCIACHGEKGKGDGAAAAALTPKPRNFTDTAFVSKEPRMRMYNIISEGGAKNGLSPMMAAWGKAIKPDQLNDVLAYVLTFSEAPAKATAQVMDKEKETSAKGPEKAPKAAEKTDSTASSEKEKPKKKAKAKEAEGK